MMTLNSIGTWEKTRMKLIEIVFSLSFHCTYSAASIENIIRKEKEIRNKPHVTIFFACVAAGPNFCSIAPTLFSSLFQYF